MPCTVGLRVLRDQEKLNTEVTEIFRGLCVEALKGRRTRRSPFRLRPPGRALSSAQSAEFFSVLRSLAGCAMVGDDVAATNQVAHHSPGDTDSRGANTRSDERRADAENSGGLRQVRPVDGGTNQWGSFTG